MTALYCFVPETCVVVRRVVEDFRIVREDQFTGVAYVQIWKSQRPELGPLVRNPGVWYALPQLEK